MCKNGVLNGNCKICKTIILNNNMHKSQSDQQTKYAKKLVGTTFFVNFKIAKKFNGRTFCKKVFQNNNLQYLQKHDPKQ